MTVSLLIFFSFSTIATTSQIPATLYIAATHGKYRFGAVSCALCGGAFDGTFSKLQAPILRSTSVLFGDFLFASFLDYPSSLVFLFPPMCER